MSNPHSPAANKAAVILLRLGLILIGTFASMFLMVHFDSALPFGKAGLYIAGLLGSILMITGLASLFRELALPIRTGDQRPTLNR